MVYKLNKLYLHATIVKSNRMHLKSICYSLIFFFFITTNCYSQTLSSQNIQQVKVSQLSDQQVLQIWKQFEASGMSEAQATQILQQKGLPATEIDAFKQRLLKLQTSAKVPAKSSISKTDSNTFKRDTIKTASQQFNRKKSLVYGYDFFNNPNLKFEPNVRIATPAGYVLGPDDEVTVMLTGLNETTVTKKISPDGNLQIPYAGIVYLNGYTIDKATSIIRSKMAKVYPGLNSGATKLTVNLGNIRSIRVIIVGEAVQPGTYTVSSVSTLFNVLYLSGGPNQRGSLRNIEIIRGNRVIKTVDLYSFLQKGILEGNVHLSDQDVIRIPVYKKRVAIDGEIKRPGLYELKDTETLEDLINYAGGFSDLAYQATAKVYQVNDKERSVRDVPSGLYDRYVPKNADSVYFEPVLNRYSNRVTLEGAVYRPGTYELSPDLTVGQLIKKADGVREDAFLTNGYVKRTKPNLDKELVPFNIKDVLAGNNDVTLMREDSVVIVSNADLRDEMSVTIDGFVRSPGTFVFRRGMRLADIILMAGGFTNDAASHHVEISRLVKNKGDVFSNQLITSISLDVDSSLHTTGNESFGLEPLDYIYVPRSVNYHAIGNVAVKGEVLFPGDYTLQRRNETPIDVIKRAGGVTPTGSLENAVMYRNGILVNLDLTNKNSRATGMLLLPGDSVVIPRQTDFVEVSGAVNNPQMLRFRYKTFSYYINAAGGVKENARLKHAYVQYPNGTSKPVSTFLFFIHNYPKVLPGSKIMVPEKSPDLRFKLGFGEVSGIATALTALIGLIAVISK
ncbi:capsule biosynthesis protein [Pedobacter sp. HMF7647]|uniref:Capsule biosynthesis protein n=1 Tax=Hufsiella arboris TaxID=2695275 RepID=A0A7K1YBH7_9SPHI|nr:SLBB domain-containing protein [Hufsiella arboris]MXV51721.1 capsule biosynthesis protein [Hufsiella arboris]